MGSTRYAEALRVGDVASAVIFLRRRNDDGLDLASAAGIEGQALDGLVAAVREPAHPIVRTLDDADPTFDVLPMNPGGPRLRSHLPIRAGARTAGVLAVAHQSPLDEDERRRLIKLATEAAAAL